MLNPWSNRGRPARGPAPMRHPQSGPTDLQQHQHQHQHQQRQQQHRRPDSLGISSPYGRPASSIYSQPSPEAAVFAAQQLRHDAGYRDPLEISPPSSPDIASSRNRHARDVSPIDEPDDMTQVTASGYGAQQQRDAEAARSNIPTMRRERRKNSDAARQALREKASQERIHQQRPHDHNVRWDPRTGEPTGLDKGRKSQVNPQAYASDLARRENYSSPPRSGQPPPQQQPSPVGQRVSRRAPSAEPENPQSRPAWQGGSGRMAIADPIRESRNAAPLVMPPRNTNRPHPGYGAPPARGNGVLSPVQSMGSSGRSTPTMATSPASKGWPSTTRSPSNQAPNSQYPSPPPERHRPPPAISTPSEHAPPSPAQPRQPQHQSQQPAAMQPQTLAPDVRDTLNVPSADKAIKRKPAGHHARPSWSSSIYSTPSQPQTPVAPTAAAPESYSPQPALQAHATFDADTRGQGESAAPLRQVEPAGQSVLDRKRPMVAGYEGQGPRSPVIDNVVRINMSSPYQREAANAGDGKPANKALKKQGLFNGASNDSVTSFSSEFKLLPPAPPEDEAKDRVAQLNAKLSALGNRRININTAIKQMTELMPTDHVLASDAVVRKREAEKRKVEALKLELAEVDRESYEIGLKLHRAYKRLDRDAEYEPTTLWVRRVTN